MNFNDYTGRMYKRLVKSISKNCITYPVNDYYLKNKHDEVGTNFIIMRHDVDGNMENALEMAKIDAKYGVKATYYFRMTDKLFNEKIIREISELGHEIGYHYEVLSDTNGDLERAKELFVGNLSRLQNITKIQTACMHGRSFSKQDNLQFFQFSTLKEFGLISEPYLSIDYSDMYYFTDTGLRWDNSKFNLRDIVKSRGNLNIKSTLELIKYIESPFPKKAAILTHTNNWVDNKALWIWYRGLFSMVNTIKFFKIKMRYSQERTR